MKKSLFIPSLTIAMSITLTGCFTTMSHTMRVTSEPTIQDDVATVALDTVTLPFQIPFMVALFVMDAKDTNAANVNYANLSSNVFIANNKEYQEEYLALKKKYDDYVHDKYLNTTYDSVLGNWPEFCKVEGRDCISYALTQVTNKKVSHGTNILSELCNSGINDESCFLLGTIKLYGFNLVRYNIITNVAENNLPKDPTSLISSYIFSLSNKNNSANISSIDDQMNLKSINLEESKKIFTKLCKNQDTEISYLSCASLKEIEYATSDKFENKEDIALFLQDINNYIQNPNYANSFSLLKTAESKKTENEASGYYFRYVDYKVNEHIKNIYYK